MNLSRASTVVRPRYVLEVLDLAIRFANVRGGRLYLALAATLLVPCWIATLAVRWLLEWDWEWVWLSALVLGSIAQGPFTIAAGRLMFSEQPTLGGALGSFARRAPSFGVAMLLTRVLLVLGSVTIVLAPLAWAFGAHIHEFTLLEGSDPGEALGRARRFVRNNVRRTLEMLLSHVAVYATAILVGEALGQGLVSFLLQLGQPFGSLEHGGSPYALAGFFTVMPLVATARFLGYIDARTRRDGWDLQVRFMALVARAEERAA